MITDSGKKIFHKNVFFFVKIDQLIFAKLKCSVNDKKLEIVETFMVALQVNLFFN